MSTENETALARRADPTTSLEVTLDQREFTPAQRATLTHMGVENATEEDLAVYLHQIQRTGLDPFSRQIHMIGRRAKKWNPQTRQESWETRWTIQTGIDGYRLIGRRAADARREAISVQAPEWMHSSGEWRPAWSKAWGAPLAARVTIMRDGQPFTAVALMDEYAQTNSQGNPVAMWRDRPAGMLAKCAEALAWRMGFPQDLSGLYTHEEMGQADNPGPVPQAAAPQAPASSRERLVAAATRPAPEVRANPETGEVLEEPDTITLDEWESLRPHLEAMGYATGQARGQFAAEYLGRPLQDPRHITRDEFAALMREIRKTEDGPAASGGDDPEVESTAPTN